MIPKGLGHSCFIVSDRKHTVILDPFVHGDPVQWCQLTTAASDPIRKDPNEFAQKDAAIGVRCVILPPGEEGTF